eukprot:Clim_evm53s147 gene=Clim_evmTU53s147
MLAKTFNGSSRRLLIGFGVRSSSNWSKRRTRLKARVHNKASETPTDPTHVEDWELEAVAENAIPQFREVNRISSQTSLESFAYEPGSQWMRQALSLQPAGEKTDFKRIYTQHGYQSMPESLNYLDPKMASEEKEDRARMRRSRRALSRTDDWFSHNCCCGEHHHGPLLKEPSEILGDMKSRTLYVPQVQRPSELARQDGGQRILAASALFSSAAGHGMRTRLVDGLLPDPEMLERQGKWFRGFGILSSHRPSNMLLPTGSLLQWVPVAPSDNPFETDATDSLEPLYTLLAERLRFQNRSLALVDGGQGSAWYRLVPLVQNSDDDVDNDDASDWAWDPLAAESLHMILMNPEAAAGRFGSDIEGGGLVWLKKRRRLVEATADGTMAAYAPLVRNRERMTQFADRHGPMPIPLAGDLAMAGVVAEQCAREGMLQNFQAARATHVFNIAHGLKLESAPVGNEHLNKFVRRLSLSAQVFEHCHLDDGEGPGKCSERPSEGDGFLFPHYVDTMEAVRRSLRAEAGVDETIHQRLYHSSRMRGKARSAAGSADAVIGQYVLRGSIGLAVLRKAGSGVMKGSQLEGLRSQAMSASALSRGSRAIGLSPVLNTCHEKSLHRKDLRHLVNGHISGVLGRVFYELLRSGGLKSCIATADALMDGAAVQVDESQFGKRPVTQSWEWRTPTELVHRINAIRDKAMWVNEKFGFDLGERVEHSEILGAALLTSPKWEHGNRSLEWCGDAVLDMLMSATILQQIEANNVPERLIEGGYLGEALKEVKSNHNLYRAAEELGLDRALEDAGLVPENIEPRVLVPKVVEGIFGALWATQKLDAPGCMALLQAILAPIEKHCR